MAYQPSVAGFVNATFETMLRRSPHLRIEAFEATSPFVLRKVQNSDVEVGIGYLPEKQPADVVSSPLIKNSLSVLVSERHALSREETVHLDALEDEPFALPWLAKGVELDAVRISDSIRAYFEAHDFTPRVVFQGNTTSSVLAVVRAGLAVSLLTALDGAQQDGVVLRPLAPKPPAHPTSLIWRKDEPRSAVAEAFAEDIRARLRFADAPVAANSSETRPAATTHQRAEAMAMIEMEAEKTKVARPVVRRQK